MRRLGFTFVLLFLAATVALGQRTPSVKIRTLTLERLTRISIGEQQRIITDIKAAAFDSGALDKIGGEVSERVRDELQQMGYFKAIVYEPRVTLVRKDGHREVVDILLAAEEGEQYRLKDIVVRRCKAFTPEQLRPQFPIGPGDIFDIKKVRVGLGNLRNLYAEHGYLNFTPVPDTQLNDVDRLTSLIIDVDEGAIFYVGKLNIAGEESEPGARDKLVQAWKKYEGRRYDPGVLNRFLRDAHVRPVVRRQDVLEVSQDNENHLVNANMSLARPFR